MILLERYVCENELRYGWKRILRFGGRFCRLVANGSRLERNGRNASGSLEFTCLQCDISIGGILFWLVCTDRYP